VKRPAWPYATKLTVSLLILVFFIYILTRFQAFIIPLIIAIIIAYVLNPLVNLFQKHIHLPRVVTIIYTYLLVLAFIVGIPYLMVTVIGQNFPITTINTEKIIATIQAGLAKQYVIFGITINPSDLATQAISSIQTLLSPVIGQTVLLLRDILTSLISVVFIIAISFFLIKDSARLEEWFTAHVPPAYKPEYNWFRNEISQIWNAFFRGQILLAAVVTAIWFVIGMILGLPFAWAMAIFAGIMEFLPSLGHGIWVVVAAILAFFLGSTWIPIPNWIFMLIVIGLYTFFEPFDDYYLIPHIIGSRVHLPPLVVILGIVAGALVAGIIGIPLAAPTIASLRVVGQYLYVNLFDLEWSPVSSVEPLPPRKQYWWRRTQRREKLP
jgi:predicted PurR-regulated permease PerM